MVRDHRLAAGASDASDASAQMGKVY